MSLRALFRVFVWAVVVGFLVDLLRRCWVVEAGSVMPLALVALFFALHRLRAAWRNARRSNRIDFLRPGLPSWDDTH